MPCVEFGTRSLTLPAMISCGRRQGSPVDGRTLSAFKQTQITVTENRTCVSPPYVDSGPPLKIEISPTHFTSSLLWRHFLIHITSPESEEGCGQGQKCEKHNR